MKREGRAAEMAECAVRVVREREYRGMARKLRPQTMHTSEGCSLHSCRGEGALCNCVYSRVKKKLLRHSGRWPGETAPQHGTHGVRSCTPAAQNNCPRSRTRLTPWLRRFSGAANAAGASEAGVLKTQTGDNASLSRNLEHGDSTTKSILIRARASLRGPRAACAVSVTVLTVKLP